MCFYIKISFALFYLCLFISQNKNKNKKKYFLSTWVGLAVPNTCKWFGMFSCVWVSLCFLSMTHVIILVGHILLDFPVFSLIKLVPIKSAILSWYVHCFTSLDRQKLDGNTAKFHPQKMNGYNICFTRKTFFSITDFITK